MSVRLLGCVLFGIIAALLLGGCPTQGTGGDRGPAAIVVQGDLLDSISARPAGDVQVRLTVHTGDVELAGTGVSRADGRFVVRATGTGSPAPREVQAVRLVAHSPRYERLERVVPGFLVRRSGGALVLPPVSLTRRRLPTPTF
jgi:hypothetical protein